MRISDTLAQPLNDRIQEALGTLSLALTAADRQEMIRRIIQSQDSLRKMAKLIANNTVRPEPQ